MGIKYSAWKSRLAVIVTKTIWGGAECTTHTVRKSCSDIENRI